MNLTVSDARPNISTDMAKVQKRRHTTLDNLLMTLEDMAQPAPEPSTPNLYFFKAESWSYWYRYRYARMADPAVQNMLQQVTQLSTDGVLQVDYFGMPAVIRKQK